MDKAGEKFVCFCVVVSDCQLTVYSHYSSCRTSDNSVYSLLNEKISVFLENSQEGREIIEKEGGAIRN